MLCYSVVRRISAMKFVVNPFTLSNWLRNPAAAASSIDPPTLSSVLANGKQLRPGGCSTSSGTRFRESSNSRSRPEAEVFLQERLQAAALGSPVGREAGK